MKTKDNWYYLTPTSGQTAKVGLIIWAIISIVIVGGNLINQLAESGRIYDLASPLGATLIVAVVIAIGMGVIWIFITVLGKHKPGIAINVEKGLLKQGKNIYPAKNVKKIILKVTPDHIYSLAFKVGEEEIEFWGVGYRSYYTTKSGQRRPVLSEDAHNRQREIVTKIIEEMVSVPKTVEVTPADGKEISLPTAIYITKNAGNNIPLDLSNQ